MAVIRGNIGDKPVRVWVLVKPRPGQAYISKLKASVEKKVSQDVQLL